MRATDNGWPPPRRRNVEDNGVDFGRPAIHKALKNYADEVARTNFFAFVRNQKNFPASRLKGPVCTHLAHVSRLNNSNDRCMTMQAAGAVAAAKTVNFAFSQIL